MAYEISYSVTMEAEAAIAMLEEKKVALSEAIDAWLVDSAELVRDTEREKASHGASGELQRSIDITYDLPAKTALIAPGASYAGYVELGTTPHMPPVDAITPWAEMHGLNPWAVAMGIKKHGTAAHPFVKPTIDELTPELLASAELAVAKVVGA